MFGARYGAVSFTVRLLTRVDMTAARHSQRVEKGRSIAGSESHGPDLTVRVCTSP
jgi:hypothetical protein